MTNQKTMKCTKCSSDFEYLSGEKEVYDKFDAPLPKVCSECRRKRHLVFRNEKNLFYNKSFKSGRKIISLYPETSPFRIIDHDEWWNDSFDATVYGRDFDFTRPFFDQYKDLQKEVPRWSRIFVNCENSDFTNNCADIKGSYLTFSSYQSEDLYYCMRVFRSNNCIDCLNVSDSQFCSQCSECKRCYNLHYSLLSDNCSDSYYLFDCKNCKNCIFSSGIQNKEYMIFNKKYERTEYEQKKEEFLSDLGENKERLDMQFEKFKKETYHRNLTMINTKNCLGNFINDSKNITNGFYIIDSEDCINVYNSSALKNCYDNSYNEKSELCLEIDTSYNLYNSKFCTYCIALKESLYCDQCDHLQNCFGCIGLKRKQYCILNKQYSKEEYQEMMKKIKIHMQGTASARRERVTSEESGSASSERSELINNEWGSPFPGNLTPFAYNTTLAYEYKPLDKIQAINEGFLWHEEKNEAKYFGKNYEIPKSIDEVDASICDKILTCEKTGKGYKIISQEFNFYKKFRLPIPRISPDQRYTNLMKLQNPYILRDVKCATCNQEIKTTYREEDNYKIICEKCYIKTVY